MKAGNSPDILQQGASYLPENCQLLISGQKYNVHILNAGKLQETLARNLALHLLTLGQLFGYFTMLYQLQRSCSVGWNMSE